MSGRSAMPQIYEFDLLHADVIRHADLDAGVPTGSAMQGLGDQVSSMSMALDDGPVGHSRAARFSAVYDASGS
jgi:hypothetical protein